jgi:hypothetical protein
MCGSEPPTPAPPPTSPPITPPPYPELARQVVNTAAAKLNPDGQPTVLLRQNSQPGQKGLLGE